MRNSKEFTNEQLVEMYVGGNNQAFDVLLRRTQTPVFSYILLLVSNEETANDVFQDTYLKAITYLQEGRYNASGKFLGWMLRIAHNAVIDCFRRRKAMHLSDFDPEMMGDSAAAYAGSSESLSDYMEHTRLLENIEGLIDLLPENQQEIVRLRIFQGYSFKEISEMTGVCMNTNLGRMRYALINLRKLAKEQNIRVGA